jgi:hypothetical protein
MKRIMFVGCSGHVYTCIAELMSVFFSFGFLILFLKQSAGLAVRS